VSDAMNETSKKDKFLLSRNAGDRILLGALCLAFCLFLVVGFEFFITWNPKFLSRSLSSILENIFWVVILFLFLFFSVVGLIWCIAAPKWLERFLTKSAPRAIFLIVALAVVSALVVCGEWIRMIVRKFM